MTRYLKLTNKITIFFIISLSVLSCAQNKTEKKALDTIAVVELDAKSFYNEIQGDSVQLVDVRTAGEYKSGHIRNAVLIDFYSPDFYETMRNTLDKSRPVYIYCRSGNRSGTAARELIKFGFKKIVDLDNGINSWTREGFDLER